MAKNKLLKVDSNAFSVISLDEQAEEEKSPHKRLEALEQTRQILYCKDTTTAGLQKILETT
jgi:hypothetical protein